MELAYCTASNVIYQCIKFQQSSSGIRLWATYNVYMPTSWRFIATMQMPL